MKPLLLLLLLYGLLVPSMAAASDAGLSAVQTEAATQLRSRKFRDREKAVELLAGEASESSRRLLEAYLAGHLFYRKADGRLVSGDKAGRRYHIADAFSGEPLGEVRKRELKKIAINNKLRRRIRHALAVMDLRHPDAARRLAAVEQMLDRPDPGSVALLQPLREQESDARVREMMDTVIALGQLSGGSADERRVAVAHLEGNVHPAVRNALRTLRDATDDPAFSAQIERALEKTEQRLRIYGLVENLFFGLSLGSVLVLAAIGLAITFGVMGVINMAHGELIMLGAYTTYVMQLLLPDSPGAALLLSIPAAFLVSGLVGMVIQRGVIRYLHGRILETLLATFGISLILQQAVRSIFSPLNRSVETPTWMSGVWEINPALSLTWNRLYIIGFCLLVFLALLLVLKRTRLGLQVRAVSQNRSMARAMGVRSEWVDAMTFGLGSGIAGMAGVALSQLTNVGPNLGQSYIIDSFMVVVFGGVGNLWGTLVGGMTLGVANKFLEPWSGAVLAKILVLVFIILFIQKRPRGLFPQKGRAAEG